ncbi:hypothetical protein AG1IA_09884 [Rhizoctonia solani AG-1 IA]|uniref:Uncharacterized protein n=1 Tax=Thanatephorus cucumeris (strain AG1-IA) TaxID=983506 RepID=L8WD26_THACA|nr:hypothetical protein AG1IA_09884 [Rhizoctonia solani AG-1 IA]
MSLPSHNEAPSQPGKSIGAFCHGNIGISSHVGAGSTRTTVLIPLRCFAAASTLSLPSKAAMQNPRVLSLRIDTNVRPSLHLPSGSLQDTPWRTPVTPGSPALFSPTNTSASTQTPVTPASRAPWFPIGGNAGSPGSCDIDILKYPNVVHAGEPRDHGAFASIERLGGSLRGLLMSKPSQSKDSQLSKTTVTGRS